MWTTLDGYRLRLPRSGNTLITVQSPGTGGQASLRRPDGSLDRSSVRFIGQVVRSSTRIGALRNTGANRRCPVFTAEVNGRHYQTITRPSATPGELVVLAVRPEVRRFSGEFSDGRGHRIVQDSIYDWLQSQGLQDSRQLPASAATGAGVILDNQTQVQGVGGRRRFPNRPDISYIAAGPDGTQRRVNVEIDTTMQGSLNHERTLIRNDPNSMHVFVMVDPVTGRVLSRRVYDPNRDRVTHRARPHDASLTLPSPVAGRQPLPSTPPPRLPVQAMRPGEQPVARTWGGAQFRPGPRSPLSPLLPRVPPTLLQRARRQSRPFQFRRGLTPGQAVPQAPQQATRQRRGRQLSGSGAPQNRGGSGFGVL
jgi:hypothetical protein